MFIKAQYQWGSFNLWNGCLNKRCFQINANIYPPPLAVLVYQSVDKLHFSCEEGFKQIPDSSVCAFHVSHASLFWQAATQHCFIMIIIFIIIVMIIMLSLFSGAKSDVCRLVVSKQSVCTASRNLSSFRLNSSVIPQLLSSQAGKLKGINEELCRVS